MSGRRIRGLVMLLLGAAGCILTGITISNDLTPKGLFGGHYTYAPPWTVHEVVVILAGAAAAILLVAGLVSSVKKDPH